MQSANGEQVIEEYGEIPDDETIAAAQSVAEAVDAASHIPGF